MDFALEPVCGPGHAAFPPRSVDVAGRPRFALERSTAAMIQVPSFSLFVVSFLAVSGANGCVSSDAPSARTPTTAESAVRASAEVPSAGEPRASPPPADPGPTTRGPTALGQPQQWACATNTECVQTCALGAVSKAWLATHVDADTCDDGCGWKSGSIACRNGECVTLTETGDIDEQCTKPAPR